MNVFTPFGFSAVPGVYLRQEEMGLRGTLRCFGGKVICPNKFGGADLPEAAFGPTKAPWIETRISWGRPSAQIPV